jgi:hypothetical protein
MRLKLYSSTMLRINISSVHSVNLNANIVSVIGINQHRRLADLVVGTLYDVKTDLKYGEREC